MKIVGTLTLAFLVVATAGGGQAPGTESASDSQRIRITKVRFAADEIGQGEEFTPGVGRPGSWPGIVVIPDSCGLNDTVRAQSKSLAAQGYLVLAIDLYKGRTPSSKEEAEKWMNSLSEPDTVRDIEGAIGFLQNWMMNPKQIGIVSWGAGGSFALRVAAKEQKLKAVVVNYGPLSKDDFILSYITSPMLVSIGASDTSISSSQITSFLSAVKTSESKRDVKIYPNSGHNFEDPKGGIDYKPEDAMDAEKRTNLFLAKWVKGQ